MCISSKTTVEWKEYTKARKQVKEMVEEKEKKVWEDVARNTGEDLNDGMNQMWVGIKRNMRNQAGRIDKGIATLGAQNGQIISSSKGERGQLVKHYRELGT